jgi:hypothetical protein
VADSCRRPRGPATCPAAPSVHLAGSQARAARWPLAMAPSRHGTARQCSGPHATRATSRTPGTRTRARASLGQWAGVWVGGQLRDFANREVVLIFLKLFCAPAPGAAETWTSTRGERVDRSSRLVLFGRFCLPGCGCMPVSHAGRHARACVLACDPFLGIEDGRSYYVGVAVDLVGDSSAERNLLLVLLVSFRCKYPFFSHAQRAGSFPCRLGQGQRPKHR